MLNIISRAWSRPELGSVYKVARNLVAGLEELDVPFVLNKEVDYCPNLWIHDDYRALLRLPKVSHGIRPLIGPNMFVLPRDVPFLVKIPEYAVLLQPSEWVTQAWRWAGYRSSQLDHWAVGIDTRGFNELISKKRDKVLFYYKSRDKSGELGAKRIEAILSRSGVDFERVNCGSYVQDDYLKLLGRSRFVVWYGCQESQGLALQEALSMGCPIIVIDVKKIGDGDGSGYQYSNSEKNIEATSAPYFDARCGVKIYSIEELPNAIRMMCEGFEDFAPREYVDENLSLKVCAENLLSKFSKWWPDSQNFLQNKSAVDFTPPWYWPLVALELRWRIRGLTGILK